MNQIFLLGNLIAHFIPGLILLSSIGLSNGHISDLYINPLKENELLVGFIMFGGALALGVCIDMCRYILLNGLELIPKCGKKYKEWRRYRQYPKNQDEEKTYNWIVDNYYRYHQFSGNLVIALFFASFCQYLLYIKVALWFLCVVLAMASGLIFRTTINCYREAFPIGDHFNEKEKD